jgi:hypothetical protein
MTRKLPWLLFCLSLIATTYLLILLFDAGLALDDSRTQSSHLRKRSELALMIARKDWIGRSSKSVEDLATELEQQGITAKRREDGSFEIGTVVFETRDGVVTQMRYFD